MKFSFEVIVGSAPEPGHGLVIEEVGAGLTQEEQSSLGNFDTALKLYRENIVGRADGTIRQHALLVDPTNFQIHGLVMPSGNLEGTTTHERYENITGDSRYVAVWLKPVRSARVYRYSKLEAQVILFRDGRGWSIRAVANLVDKLKRLIRDETQAEPRKETEDKLAKLVINLAIELSESRAGGSVYFVRNRDSFKAMESMGKKLGSSDAVSDKDRELAGNVVIGSCKTHPPRVPIFNLSHERQMRLLSEDGAVVLTAHGDLCASRTYFNGPGGRRSIARAICGDTGSRIAAIVVSQDGPIYLAGRTVAEDPPLVEVDHERYL